MYSFWKRLQSRENKITPTLSGARSEKASETRQKGFSPNLHVNTSETHLGFTPKLLLLGRCENTWSDAYIIIITHAAFTLGRFFDSPSYIPATFPGAVPSLIRFQVLEEVSPNFHIPLGRPVDLPGNPTEVCFYIFSPVFKIHSESKKRQKTLSSFGKRVWRWNRQFEISRDSGRASI